MHPHSTIGSTQKQKTASIVSVAVLGTSIPTAVLAMPYSAIDFTGLIYFFYALFALFLICAIFVNSKFGKFLLIVPALLVAYTHTRDVFVWEADNFRVIRIGIGFAYATAILFIVVQVSKVRTSHVLFMIPALVLCYAMAILLNPAYFNFVGLIPEENDPFDGKGVTVLDIIENQYTYGSAENQKRVDNTLVLDDGRRIPGIFHGVSVGDTVLLKKTVGDHYAYHQYGLVETYFQPVLPRFSFPSKNLVTKKVKLNYSTGVDGWGHDF